MFSPIKICNFEGYIFANLITQTMKDTLKILELLEEHIDRLSEQGIYEIERDLLLESLRGIYTSVLTIDTIAGEDKFIESLLGLPEELLEPNDEEMYGCPPEDFEEIEESVEEALADEEIELVIEEPLPSPEAEVEPEPIKAQIEEQQLEEEQPEEVASPTAEEPITEPEPIVEEPEVSEEIDHEALISLYDDDDEEEKEPTEEPKVAEDEYAIEEHEVEEEPVVEEETAPEIEEEFTEMDEEPIIVVENSEEPQSVVLGDVLATEQTTIADNFAEQMVDVATASGAALSLRQTIALNDKFILMRDLFGGNNDYYEKAIDQLDSFDNLDEAMLYIYDNFHWNPNSEGARLLMEFLARKLI